MKFKKLKTILFHVYVSVRRSIYIFLGMLNSLITDTMPNVFVVSYHSVDEDGWRYSIDTKEIKKQINYLSKKFKIIDLKTLERIVDGKTRVTRPSIVITFDDGYKDILKLKLFFLKKNINPAIFILSDPKNPNWTELGSKRKFLNKAEIMSLAEIGYEIGSHSKSHSNLSRITGKALDIEVIGSKKSLEKSLGLPVRYFAYPRGKYNSEVLTKVRKAGYKLALSMDDGFISSATNPLIIPRIGIDRTHSFSEFKYLFSKNNINMRKIVKKSYLGKYI